MLSHEPEVSRLLHSEHTERLAQDAQQPMESVSLPSTGFARVLARLSVITHGALAVRHRRAYDH